MVVLEEKDQEVPNLQTANSTLLSLLTRHHTSTDAPMSPMNTVILECPSPKTTYIKQEQSLPDIDTLFNDIRMAQSESKGAIKVTSSHQTSNDDQPLLDNNEHELLDLDRPSEFTFYDDQMIIKQEPVYQNENSFHSNSDAEDLESVESMIMDSVSQDIQFACQVLDIPRDPLSWTSEQVQKWVLWTLDEYNLPRSLVEHFQTNGYRLCNYTESELLALNATAGSTLYAQLDIWRNSLKYNDCTTPTQQTTMFVDSVCSFDKNTVFGDKLGWAYNSTTYTPTTVSMETPPPSVSPTPSSDSVQQDSTGFKCRFGFDGKSQSRPRARQTIHLWQFLRELLDDSIHNGNAIRWVDSDKGIFKIEDSVRVAKLWGKRKNRPAMNYDKLSRSIRQYYKKGIIRKTDHSKRLVYQFCTPYL